MAGLLVNSGYISRLTDKIVEEFDVRNCKSTTRVADLSGGNLQKLLVGRELALSRNIVLVVNPTTGLDVGAIDAIWEQIIRIADEGAGVLLVSNELDELLALSDRIVVFYNGEIAGEVEGNDAHREALGKLMSGVRIK
jgi:simple sugar transport system ATP-binding protein